MRALVRFGRLPRNRRALVVSAVWLVGAIRLGLWLVPFRFVHQSVERASKRAARRPPDAAQELNDIVWAVTAVSRRVPGATCLTQALAGRLLMSRAGIPTQLQIGVARGENGALTAHAWVESNGQIVIGGADSGRHFTALRPRDTKGDEDEVDGESRVRRQSNG